MWKRLFSTKRAARICHRTGEEGINCCCNHCSISGAVMGVSAGVITAKKTEARRASKCLFFSCHKDPIHCPFMEVSSRFVCLNKLRNQDSTVLSTTCPVRYCGKELFEVDLCQRTSAAAQKQSCHHHPNVGSVLLLQESSVD